MFDWLTPGVGFLAGGLIDAFAGHSANQANTAAANANRDFSRNAHQIEVADLEKAGLSPMLSYRGSGASLGGGVLPDVKPVTRNTAETLNSAIMAAKQGHLIESQTRQADSQTTKNDADANAADATAARTRVEKQILERQLGGGKVETDIRAVGASAERSLQEIEESRARMSKMQAEIKQIGVQIDLTKQEKDLKVALETGAKIDNQIKDANYNSILSMAKSDALIKMYEATEKELGAKAAQASWRVWLAEKGLTITQIENIMGALPNVALIYPMKNITNTFVNPVKH
ncbi:MAG: hypothetical protein [Microviridae sp.]|nr:MAG: hypothetical protein [Microviridae sp.]